MISLNFCPAAILYKRRTGEGGKTWHNALSETQPEFYVLIKPTLIPASFIKSFEIDNLFIIYVHIS